MLTFGSKVTYTNFDYNIFQGHDPICAIRCQEMILRDYGIQIPKEDLIAYATEQGWYHGGGTKPCDVGNLLETCHIETHSQHCDSVYDLINELKEGHRVIVGVDARELWAERGTEEYEFYRNLTKADHALIVTSVNIDPESPEQSTVVLTDPGNGSIAEYDFEKFAHSWRDSNFFMMATNEPAPYQYNAETQCMEMSNFATDFALQEFPFHNEFTDIWEVEKLGYVPYYENGHLWSITEDLLYEDFAFAYNNDCFDILDDSLNMYDDTECLVHVDFSDGGVVTEITPIDNLFDCWSDSMSDNEICDY